MTGALGTTVASFAAQDFRASRARVVRALDAGETVETCSGCGTETGVEVVAHSPSCAEFAPPAAEVAAAPAGGRGKGWERGRNGQRRSVQERDAAGGLTVGEMQRRHEVFLDSVATVTSCGIEGCGWSFSGSAAEGREAAAAHRASVHPGLRNGRRRASAAPAPSDVRPTYVEGPGADSAPEPEREPEPEPEAEATLGEACAERLGPDGAASPNGRTRWTREAAIAAVQAFAAEHGRPPTHADRIKPTSPTAMRLFGSWAALIEAAGFPRPTRATRYRAGPSRNGSGREPSGPAAAAAAEAQRLTTSVEPPGSDDPVAPPTTAAGTAERGSRPEVHEAPPAGELSLRELLVVALRGAADALEAAQ